MPTDAFETLTAALGTPMRRVEMPERAITSDAHLCRECKLRPWKWLHLCWPCEERKHYQAVTYRERIIREFRNAQKGG